MAETVAVPQKSLWERTLRVGNLLNQGVESMVAGTLSLPALVADGYINIYRTAREAAGGKAFEASDLYSKSKQSLTDTGRKMDGSHGKIVGAQDATEAKIVFGAELVTGLAGPGAIKSLKTIAEGNAVLTAGTTAAKATATTAATKAGGTIEWVAPKLSSEAAEFAAQAAAKRAAREAAGAGAANTAGTAAKAAATTEKAIESTSSSLLGTAGKAASYAWTSLRVTTAPFRHPVLTLGAVSGGHLLTGGKSSELIWDGAIGSWNLAKEYVPGAAAAVAEGTLKLGDGMMGFLATGGKKGAEGLANHLPPGTPVVLREALGSVGKKNEDGTPAPTLRERAQAAMSGARERGGDAADAARDAVEDIDAFDLPEAGPFREMIAKHLGMDPKKVNGKEMMSKMGEMAKNNPYAATGMAFGTMLGMMEGGTKGQKALKAMVYGAVFAIGFQMIGQFFPGLMPAIGNMLGGGMKSLGLDPSTMKGQFTGAANGLTDAPKTAAPAAKTPEAANDTTAQFRASAEAATRPALTPAPDQLPVVRTPAEIMRARTNDRQFALEA